MSPLWRDEVGAYLSPHRLCLVRMKRGTKPTQVAEHEQRFEGAKTDSWAAALEAFASMLGEPPWAGARTRVVIADHWARYAIVPWVAALNSALQGVESEHLHPLEGAVTAINAQFDIILGALPGIARKAAIVAEDGTPIRSETTEKNSNYEWATAQTDNVESG